MNAREAATALGISHEALQKRLRAGQVQGAKKIKGRWSIPKKAIAAGSIKAPSDLPAAPAPRNRVDTQYKGLDLEALKAEEIRLHCVRKCREERIKQSEVVDVDAAIRQITAISVAAANKLRRFPDDAAERICDRMGITDNDHRHAVHQDLQRELQAIQQSVVGEYERLVKSW